MIFELFRRRVRQDARTGRHALSAHDLRKLLGPSLEAYGRRLEAFGPDPRSAFWKGEESQQRRFGTLVRLIDPADVAVGYSLSDVGCGYGALFDFLEARGMADRVKYVGYDACSGMVRLARRRIRDPRARFVTAHGAREAADYTVASGTFNLCLEADRAAWKAYVVASLRDMWHRSRKGMAFNMLDAAVSERSAGLFYANGDAFRRLCATEFSPRTELVRDSHLADWTIFVRR